MSTAVIVPIHSEPPWSRVTPKPKRVADVGSDRMEGAPGIVGTSEALQHALGLARIVAPTDSTVLIYGETGTGKELCAQLIHEQSLRSAGPFVRLNCAAIPEGLLESELFGHEKGAFTSAVAQRAGRFEAAHRGTLFLDEIGELPLSLQPKLLRVLQEQEFERLGSSRTVSVDVRVIAATNRDLTTLVAEKTFRMDLFYRLNVFPLTLPPLRDRREDIPSLIRHFASGAATRMRRPIRSIPPETIQALAQHCWPGNVRELQNVIERAVILAEDGVLRVPFFEPKRDVQTAPPSRNTLSEVERDHIVHVLDETGWLIGGPSGAARYLGLPRTTLISKMRRLGIQHGRSARLSKAGQASEPAAQDQPANLHPSYASLVPDIA
jgi:formate hydrogenlyase transcriptional activator